MAPFPLLRRRTAQITAENLGPAVPEADPEMPLCLDALPAELHHMVLAHVTEEDDREALGATSRYWQAVVRSTEPENLDTPQYAFDAGHRHALARALRAPPDASSFTTGWRNTNGMTPLMHAARGDDRAMLRVLLRHTEKSLDQTDDMGLTARHWACMTGRQEEFDEDVRRAERREQQVSLRAWPSLSLHKSIRQGHHHLTRTLLDPHFEGSGWHLEGLRYRPGRSPVAPLSCGEPPVACALAHTYPAPDPRTLDALDKPMGSLWHPTDAELSAMGRRITTTTEAWLLDLEPLVRRGFDIHRCPEEGTDRRSYYARWCQDSPPSLSRVRALEQLCGPLLTAGPTGAALFEACLSHAEAAHHASVRRLLEALLHCGARLDVEGGSIDATARRIAAIWPLDDVLWAALRRQGAQLAARDAQGRTLAHHALERDRAGGQLLTLIWLHERGAPVFEVCDRGENPCAVWALRLSSEHFDGLLVRAYEAGLLAHGPHRARRGAASFDANTLLEAALFHGRDDLAKWLVIREFQCSLGQLTQSRTRLDADYVTYDRKWLSGCIRARRLGMRGHYSWHFNPAGAWHTALSTPRLQAACDKQRDKTAKMTSEGKQVFWQTVRTSALGGAVRARYVAKPLTLATDALLGTQRSRDDGALRWPVRRLLNDIGRPTSESRAVGAVGAGVAVVATGVFFPVSLSLSAAVLPAAWAVTSFDSDTTFGKTALEVMGSSGVFVHYGLDRGVCFPLVQTAAILGCIPKAVVTAGGMAAGAIVGVGKGLAR